MPHLAILTEYDERADHYLAITEFEFNPITHRHTVGSIAMPVFCRMSNT